MQKSIQTDTLDAAKLRLLACPVCHAFLVVSQANLAEVVCSGCARHYPVRDGLLVLLASAAIQ